MYGEKIAVAAGIGQLGDLRQVAEPGMMRGTADPPKSAGVPREAEHLMTDIEKLNAVVQELRARLDTALLPCAPATPTKGGNEAVRQGSPIAGALSEMRYRIRGIMETVLDMHQRLDV